MKTIAVFLAIVAAVYAEAEAEADPQLMLNAAPGAAQPSGFVYHYQTYHNTPASTAPLVTAKTEDGEQRVVLNPYNGAYNPYWYSGLPYNYGAYAPYGAAYGAYPYNAWAGYRGYPYGYNGLYGYPRVVAGLPAAAAAAQ